MYSESKSQGLRVVWALAALLLALASRTEAQPKKVGFLGSGAASANASRIEAFRQGLRELGYIEGKNIVIEWRYADANTDRLDGLAAELVHLKADIIVTGGRSTTRAAKKATATIPIVMAQDADPVENGFVASLARPGGNVTGMSTIATQLSGKELELLKEVVPRLTRVAVLGTSITPSNAEALREAKLAAERLGLQIQYLDLQSPGEIEAAFAEARKGRAGALLMLPSPILFLHITKLVDLTTKNRLPAIYFVEEFIERGGLMIYGPRIADLFRRAATYVDKILKGAKPADLPVEQPTKFELVINLKAAKQIGLTIPPNVLARADRVIK
jgi:putative ABC transport system substrate-binding protein